jgi:hypothetical protein
MVKRLLSESISNEVMMMVSIYASKFSSNSCPSLVINHKLDQFDKMDDE